MRKSRELTIPICILCDYYLLLQKAMDGKGSLENKITQKGDIV